MYLYSLIIKQLDMNKDKEIERLKKQISKLREENRQLKSEARIAKRKATKADKKKDAMTTTFNKEQEQLLSDLLRDIDFQS